MSKRKNEAGRNRIKRNLESYVFLIPNLILFLSCSVYPVLWALKYVFYQYGGYGAGTPRFVGMENLARVFRDKVYWESMVHTFTYGSARLLSSSHWHFSLLSC